MIKCSNDINACFRNKAIDQAITLSELLDNMRDILIRNMHDLESQQPQPVDFKLACLTMFFSKEELVQGLSTIIPINIAMLADPQTGKPKKFVMYPTSVPSTTDTMAVAEMDGDVIVHYRDETHIYIDVTGCEQLTTYADLKTLTEGISMGVLNPTHLFNEGMGYAGYRLVGKKDHKTIAAIAKRLTILSALPQQMVMNNSSLIVELTDYRVFIAELIIPIDRIIQSLFIKGKYDIEGMVATQHFDVKETLALARQYPADWLDSMDSQPMNDLALLQCMLGVMGATISNLLDQEFIEVRNNNVSYREFQPPEETQPENTEPPKPNYS